MLMITFVNISLLYDDVSFNQFSLKFKKMVMIYTLDMIL